MESNLTASQVSIWIQMASSLIIFFGFFLIFSAIAFMLIYNSIIMKRNQIRNAFGSIDVMLKKRYDLIPNIVESVKGYAKYEKETLEQIAKLRAMAISGPATVRNTIEVDAAITPLLTRLLAVVENYPQLKANEGFLHLQRTLAELEEQISAARRFFNSSVLDYNNAIQTMPGVIVASLIAAKPEEFFVIAAAERGVTKAF